MQVEPALGRPAPRLPLSSSQDPIGATLAFIGGVGVTAFVVSSVVLHVGLVDARLYLELALASALVYGAALTAARVGGERLRASPSVRRQFPARPAALSGRRSGEHLQ